MANPNLNTFHSVYFNRKGVQVFFLMSQMEELPNTIKINLILYLPHKYLK